MALSSPDSSPPPQFIRHRWSPVGAKDLRPPREVKELTAARCAGSWEVPQIPKIGADEMDAVESSDQEGLKAERPVWVALYIFSTPTAASRARRNLIRKYDPLDTLPTHLRSLVRIRFVVGYANPDKATLSPEDQLDVRAMEDEAKTYDDMVRLEGLVNGENMNRGKSWEWAVWAGQEGREAQWVLSKCDDDVWVPLFAGAKLITDTRSTSCSRISSACCYSSTPPYLPISDRALTTGQAIYVPRRMYTGEWDEDAFMGEMMYLLPTKPQAGEQPTQTGRYNSSTSYQSHFPHTPPRGGWNSPPPRIDPRTGLLRIDLEYRLGAQWDWWIAGPETAVGWHPVKEEQQYVDAYNRAWAYFVGRYGKYEWAPPAGWQDRLLWEGDADQVKQRHE
ncbi:uncharacterized protein MKK02DRAFT_33129 [Dioszegia hungarica]|uniref:Uncharacterized protein n=1 Tax=Dioszegia hungarica TaxID=4972 RepID=A0AA38HAJ0_9TREE|nr:uncharacterized protein MKK02DRAFT_33129 [Dioszegia hungarica]KAI9635779.1 hypothetical protein MKK02DRAFT_33129 [Dioszegia hungarica]